VIEWVNWITHQSTSKIIQFSNNNLSSFLLDIKQSSFTHKTLAFTLVFCFRLSLFILIQTQMALIILRHVLLTLVLCSMTSHATEVSNTFKVKMNATESKVCAVDVPSTVIWMELRAMRIHCGGKCNEKPFCMLFQMKEDLKQCELFTYLPQNFIAIDHCSAYVAPTGKHIVLKFKSEYLN